MKKIRKLTGVVLAFAIVLGIFPMTVLTSEAALSTNGGGIANGTYYFRNRHTGLFMSVLNNSTTSGALVVQTVFNESSLSQRWQITDMGNGHSLTPMHATGLRLHFDPGWAMGTQVEVRTAANTTAQRFGTPLAPGGTPNANYSVRQLTQFVAPTTRVVEVRGGWTPPGTAIQMHFQNPSSPWQDWEVIPAVVVTRDSRVRYDAQALNSMNTIQMRDAFNYATNGFYDRFAIDFGFLPHPMHDTLLDLTCAHPGNTCVHGTNFLDRTIQIANGFPRTHVIGISGRQFCPDDSGGWGQVGGFASTTTTTWGNAFVQHIIRHELTHNLGLVHCSSGNSECVMGGADAAIWCVPCSSTILRNRRIGL